MTITVFLENFIKINILNLIPTYNRAQSMQIDLLVAWNWTYDRPFIERISERCRSAGQSVLTVDARTIEDVLEDILSFRIRPRFFFDRASDESDRFIPLAEEILNRSTSSHGAPPLRFVNAPPLARRASDKTIMHRAFIENGISVPASIIIPSFRNDPSCVLNATDLEPIGAPFVVKPSNTTGGGTGVVLSARSWNDIDVQRRQFPDDAFLAQQRIVPAYLSESRGWFRSYYSFGETYLCWWDDESHVYDIVSPDDERMFGLQRLRDMTRKIATVCTLDFFSTEIAITQADDLVSVDYVNEICDMRARPETPNGVPTELVEWFCDTLISTINGAKSNAVERH
jgi:hypothetical protein